MGYLFWLLAYHHHAELIYLLVYYILTQRDESLENVK
jgi:hypothetical protein